MSVLAHKQQPEFSTSLQKSSGGDHHRSLKMASFEGIPVEIKLMIIDNIRSLETLFNLELSSRVYKNTIEHNQEIVYSTVLQNEMAISAGAMKLAVLLYNLQMAVKTGVDIGGDLAIMALTGLKKNTKFELVRLEFAGDDDDGQVDMRAPFDRQERIDCLQALLNNHHTAMFWTKKLLVHNSHFNAAWCETPKWSQSGTGTNTMRPEPISDNEMSRGISSFYRMWCFVTVCSGTPDIWKEHPKLFSLITYLSDGSFWKYRSWLALYEFFKDYLKPMIYDVFHDKGVMLRPITRPYNQAVYAWSIKTVASAVLQSVTFAELQELFTVSANYQRGYAISLLKPIRDRVEGRCYVKRDSWSAAAAADHVSLDISPVPIVRSMNRKFPFDIDGLLQRYDELFTIGQPPPGMEVPQQSKRIYRNVERQHEYDPDNEGFDDLYLPNMCLQAVIWDDERLLNWGFLECRNARELDGREEESFEDEREWQY